MCYTPDRPTNPPDEDQKQDCPDCKGSGTILIWSDEEEEGEETPEKETCPTCKGEGEIDKDDEEEW